MDVGVGGIGNKGEDVVKSGGIVNMADGGEARWKNCCRFGDGIFGELWDDLPYRLPFTLDIRDVCL